MKENYYIFGGTFDPIHEGHIGVLRELDSKNIVIAPTEANPLKHEPSNSLVHRIDMIEKVLKYENIPYQKLVSPLQSKIYVSYFAYRYVCDFVDWWRKNFDGNLIWVIGPDLVDQVTTWKNWEALAIEVYVAKSHANNLHSSDIRSQKYPIHPALR